MKRFGEKLRTLRKHHGLTQVQLAQQTHLTQSTISELEKRKYNPGVDIVITIADFFGVSLDILVRDELELDTDAEPSSGRVRPV